MIVDEFIENPKPLSAFSNPENHWPDFLALLHLLLIKNGEKKFHMLPHEYEYSKNICSLADKLELKWKVVSGSRLFEYQKQVTSIPQIVLDVIGNAIDGTSNQELVIAKDECALDDLEGSKFSDSNIGKILEYPDCCVNWFVNNKSSGWEEVYEFVIENTSEGINSPAEPLAEMMYQYNESDHVRSSKKRMNKILVNHIAESRNTMPFIFFQPCDACIGPSSPSRKLNEKYANFAKENYPELYKKIIEEGKKDAKSFQ